MFHWRNCAPRQICTLRGAMTDYGKKIAELRAASKMTQAELGAKLNVTSQAVSKWENGLSEPDIESIRKICQIFNITFDEFFGAEPKTEEEAKKPTAAVVLAYCDVCDKPLYDPKEYQVTIENGVQHTTCKECIPKKEEAKRQARDERLTQQRKYMQREEADRLKKGLLWGILGAAGLAGIVLIGGLSGENKTWEIVVFTLLAAYGGYAIVSQCIWANSVLSVLLFFVRSFKLPGIIFTLSINGLIFLIVVKLLGAVLCVILSVLLFIVGFFITWFYAMLIFPFGLIKQIKDVRTMY